MTVGNLMSVWLFLLQRIGVKHTWGHDLPTSTAEYTKAKTWGAEWNISVYRLMIYLCLWIELLSELNTCAYEYDSVQSDRTPILTANK